MNPRMICGVHVVNVVVEDFGPIAEAGKVINLETMRQFFAFLQNKETANLMVRVRSDLIALDKDFEAGQQQIGRDASSSVMETMASEYHEQRSGLLRSLRAAEHTVSEMGLDQEGTMQFLLLAEMLDCSGAHKILLRFIASDFANFSALPEWSNPLMGAATFRKLMELVPASEFDSAPAPQMPGNVEVYGYNQIQGTTRAAEIAAVAPPPPDPLFIQSPSKSVAAMIKDKLKADTEQQKTEKAAAKPHVVRRSAVRLRERERALVELRERFYDTTTIDDSVLDFPHNQKSQMVEAPLAQSQTTTVIAEAPAKLGTYPTYFNTAVARRKAANKVEPRYNKSPFKAEVPEQAPQSPQGPPVAPEKARELSTIAAAEVIGMKEQLSMLLTGVNHRMEDIFCTADTIKNEGEAVQDGLNLVEDLRECLKEIPEAMIANDKEAVMDNSRPLADTTYPIAHKLASGADAIRSHHNLFSQFQFKCLPLKEVLTKVMDRAENVAGRELLDQYRKDTAMVGFEKSKAPTNRRVMGTKGKTRRLGSTVRGSAPKAH